MKLPGRDRLVVSERKIRDYLLSLSHLIGRHKALWLMAFGFDQMRWRVLAEAICAHAAANDVAASERSPFGVR